MKEITIKVLRSGYYVIVKKDNEVIDEIACNHGRWNLGPILHEHVDGYSNKSEKEEIPKEQKKKTKKKAIK